MCDKEVVEYEDEDGQSPFSTWFLKLKAPAALKVTTAITKMENGNFGDVKPVGQGVSETRIHFQQGYRIYFGRDGDKLVVLLGGSTKKRQDAAIEKAQTHWKTYKARKKKERN